MISDIESRNDQQTDCYVTHCRLAVSAVQIDIPNSQQVAGDLHGVL